MDDDWDLQAVVRGCTTTATTPTPTPTPSTSTSTTTKSSSCAFDFYSFSSRFEEPPQQAQNDNLLCFQNPFEPRNQIEELCDLYKPFFTKPSPPQAAFSPKTMPASSPLSVLGAFQDLSSPSPQQQQKQQKQQKQQPQQQLLLQHTQVLQPKQLPSSSVPRSGFSTSASNAKTHTQSPRSKRRKNQMKRVCQVPAEGLSSDMWSWRKYGQKPIKGSPYPRGYYRCSTSKGCLARKQVERNRSDPNMFIVTYTAEHNHPMPTHRNSLAGSTRQKPTASGEPNKPTSSPPESPATSLSPAPEKLESSREEKDELIEEDDDDFGISDMPLDDDFFAGLDVELVGTGPALNDCFSDHLPANGQFPWLANSVTTTAAGGG